jgi:hypothetical protein
MAITSSFSSGTLSIFGDALDNPIAVSRDAAGNIFVNNGTVPITGGPATVANTSLIQVSGQVGADIISLDETNGALPPAALFGGDGNDVLTGGIGIDQLDGGDGNDTVTGGRGNDVAFLGAGDDTFIWNPGDGSDTIEGQDGLDTLFFNGANINENIDISANGSRVRFFRDVGNVTMDADGVETIAFKALGGADTITVNDLAGTDVTKVAIDLQASGGGGDGQADTVIVNAGGGNDQISVAQNGSQLVVGGLAAQITVDGAEPANDVVRINGNGGTDTTTINGGNGTETFSISANGAFVRVSRIDAPSFNLDVGTENLVINANGGDDVITAGNGLAALIQLQSTAGLATIPSPAATEPTRWTAEPALIRSQAGLATTRSFTRRVAESTP